MEKIRLNNGTLLEIQSGASEYNISILAPSIDEVLAEFTDENLARYEILTEDGSVCAIYTKKYLKKLTAEATEDGYLVTIVLEDVNELYERVKHLEATVETLQAEIEAQNIVPEPPVEPEIEDETILDEEGTEEPTEIVEDSTNEESTEPTE